MERIKLHRDNRGESSSIISLVEDLCKYRTGVVAPENDALFQRIADELPVQLHRFPSGSEHNGWVVPGSWSARKALVKKDGEVLFDGTKNAIGVAANSKSFSGTLDFKDLKKHIVTDRLRPKAHVFHCRWQYRPWDADWALSVPYDVFSRWEPGSYEVELETEQSPGNMIVAECLIPGELKDTIVFNAHTCHPHMANDGFSGVASIIRLFQWLGQKKRRYSYRCVFGPEHLGSIFYLRDRSKEEIRSMVSCVFVEMTGAPQPIKAAATFLGDQRIDKSIRHVLRHQSRGFTTAEWRCGAGNDETVWEAPGYEIPCVELTRCKDQFDPFPEYHTDLDTPESLVPDNVTEFYDVLLGSVEVLEQDARIVRKFDGLLCLSHPKYDLYFERPDPSIEATGEENEKWGALLDSLLRYFDGSMTILDIAEKHDLPFRELAEYLRRYEAKGLIGLSPDVVVRITPVMADSLK